MKRRALIVGLAVSLAALTTNNAGERRHAWMAAPSTPVVIDRPNCPICGKRILWIMRAAGCCLGPFR